MITKFENYRFVSYSCGNKKKTREEIQKVALMVKEDQDSNVHASHSIRRIAEALNMPRSTVHIIMQSALRYYSYKFQPLQKLRPNDFETPYWSSLQFPTRHEIDSKWPLNILPTDEVLFYLDRSVNAYNYRIRELLTISNVFIKNKAMVRIYCIMYS